MGSTGPASTDPATGKRRGPGFSGRSRFPDMVRAPRPCCWGFASASTRRVLRGRRLDGRHAGRREWDGGLSQSAAPSALRGGLQHAALGAEHRRFHARLGRQAVMADPRLAPAAAISKQGKPFLDRGLGVVRAWRRSTTCTRRYAALHRKFGRAGRRTCVAADALVRRRFQVESYLRYQGSSFVERFDANSYLYLTRAMDYFDIAADHDGVLARAFRGIQTRFCVVSFTSDWLFPHRSRGRIVHALNASSARVSFAEIETDRGHVAFLLERSEFFDISRAFLEFGRQARGLAKAGRPV